MSPCRTPPGKHAAKSSVKYLQIRGLRLQNREDVWSTKNESVQSIGDGTPWTGGTL